MSKLKLIIQHEYLTIVGKKSFIVMTLLIPFLIVLVGAVPAVLAYINSESDTTVTTIAVIDESGAYGRAFTDTDNYHFLRLDAAGTAIKDPHDFYKNARESIDAVLVLPQDVLESERATLYSEKTLDHGTVSHIEDCLNDTLGKARIAQIGDPDLEEKIEQTKVSASLKSIKWDDNGDEQEQSATYASILGMVLSFLTYTFVLSYGAMIMNSVVEEKTNRIVEVIVSSCRPMELMMGKIIGVGLVGLTQFAVWVLLIGIGGFVLSLVGVAASGGPDAMAMSQGAVAAADTGGMNLASIMSVVKSINYFSLLGNFVIYFIGGYLLYASLFAGFGSAVDQASDSSQFTMPIILIMVIALYAGIACMENPGGPMAVWCSIIPFTSPIVMMVRLPYDVPLWQMLLSIVLLYATALGCVWISARIYRTGILLYGKKRSFREILRWIR